MTRIEDAKKEYETMEIPEELSGRVLSGIAEGRRRVRRRHALRRTLGSVAACLAVLTAGLNLFPTFAEAAADVPVLGRVCEVLTVRSWQRSEEGESIRVTQPAVSGSDEFARRINAEIQKRVEAKSAEGDRMVQEYKEAFLSTGGTEEEWAQRDNTVRVSYDVKAQTESTVSFVVSLEVSTSVGYQEDDYYNLDVAADKELTLRDLLGDDWVNLCNTSIKRQMADSEDPSVYFDSTMGGFESVDETTNFYINASGNPVVVFPRATVAIGAMGQVEFEITK